MIQIVQFEPRHLLFMEVQGAQIMVKPVLRDPAYAPSLKNGGPAFSAIADGRVYCCAGVLVQWAGRGIAWALLARGLGARFIPIHRAVKQFLHETPIQRIEATAELGFPEAHRWLLSLQFVREAERLRSYTPDGSDHALYALVKS